MTGEPILRKAWPSSSIGELLDYLKPGVLDGVCPPWPPDVFALTASVLRRNGAYVRALELVPEGSRALLGNNVVRQVRSAGAEWRKAVLKALEKFGSPLTKSDVESALAGARLPGAVKLWWKDLLSHGSVLLETTSMEDKLCHALLKLCLAADEACTGLGIEFGSEEDFFLDVAEYPILDENLWSSLCLAISPDKVRVLPKQHTPQRGITVRSLSHNLALCPASEVAVTWNRAGNLARFREFLSMNFLLLPWPLEVRASSFELLEPGSGLPTLPGSYRFFSFRHPGPSLGFVDYLQEALKKAKEHVQRIDGFIFPELALTYDEYREAEKIALQEKVLLIAGVAVEPGEANCKAATNACFVQSAGLTYATGGREEVLKRTRVMQAKHHRWCLDRNQILQYGLGGMLPASRYCWEHTDIGQRVVRFTTLGSSMTMSVLVCEDLARQDPVSDILRAVGPNLVVALLMDGPQLRSRWPSRYASVLAEDPGCSVLTLTSLGMAKRSQAPPGEPDRSGVIALWRDVFYGERELELRAGEDAAVLSLSCNSLEEFSADGRGDGGSALFPVFAGLHTVKTGFLKDRA